MRQQVSAPATSALLEKALYDAGSADPERDAATISVVAFGRLEQFLWGRR